MIMHTDLGLQQINTTCCLSVNTGLFDQTSCIMLSLKVIGGWGPAEESQPWFKI